ncbi:MAG: DUF1735 domain-containing protein [Mangrovibacterium sp.]
MKKLYSIFALVLVLMLFSCEKGTDLIDYDSTVYLPQYGLSNQTVLLGESVFELAVYKAGINQEHAAVTVTMQVDQAAFDTFRASNPEYSLLPERYYSIESMTVAISKDQEKAPFRIQLKGVDESFTGKKYILPVSIAGVSPSVNLLESQQTVFLSFSSYRNVYESAYKAYGKVTPLGSEEVSIKVDEEVSAATVSANTISVKGAENNMDLLLTVKDSEVLISGTSGSANFQIRNTAGKTSTYSGTFDPVQQCNRGTFLLFYTYTVGGQDMNAEVELRFLL